MQARDEAKSFARSYTDSEILGTKDEIARAKNEVESLTNNKLVSVENDAKSYTNSKIVRALKEAQSYRVCQEKMNFAK